MLPLLGPLAPVVQNVHDALELCLLSEHHSTAAEPPAEKRSKPSAAPIIDRFRTGSAPDKPPPPTAISRHSRVPYFVLVRKLEEAAAALRLERDSALEEVSRNVAEPR